MIYLYYHNNQWMCFEGELPPEDDPMRPVPGASKWLKEREEYLKAIATLKSKALPVANPELLAEGIKNYSEKLNGVKISAFVSVEGEIYEWPGTVIVDKCWQPESYTLYLPKPDMSDKEPLPEMFYIDGPDEFVKGEASLTEQERIEKAKSEVAKKYELGRTLVTGHRASYWEEAMEIYAKEENARLRKLIDIAFVTGRSRTTWEQFKKDNDFNRSWRALNRMKTYQDFYKDLYHKNLITGKLEELAAKEYAKQWIDVAYKNTFMPKQIAEQFKKQIDEQ